jgi:hypothetical protein
MNIHRQWPCDCRARRTYRTYVGEIATQDPARSLAAVTEQLAKLPAQLWHTGNDGFADIATALDALAAQVDSARVGLVQEAETRGVVDQSPSPGATDWLLAHSLHLEPDTHRHCHRDPPHLVASEDRAAPSETAAAPNRTP